MTVASGSGDAVADEGMNRPVAVFYNSHQSTCKRTLMISGTYSLGLESLD